MSRPASSFDWTSASSSAGKFTTFATPSLPLKVEAVRNWPVPTTTTELRSFLGFASCYRRFIHLFAKIVSPLHDLVAEGSRESKKKASQISHLWEAKHQTAFNALKAALTSASVLGYADLAKPFILQTDASHDGLSAILSQQQDGKQRVIAFASRRLRPTEKNEASYSSMKLEFLAMKWAITEKFLHYLIGANFTVLTDNNPLVHFNIARLGALEQRWAAQLAQFNFSVQYRQGSPTRPTPSPVCPLLLLTRRHQHHGSSHSHSTSLLSHGLCPGNPWGTTTKYQHSQNAPWISVTTLESSANDRL